MELIALPFAFLLWFLAYEAKPVRKDEATTLGGQVKLDF